MAAVARLGATPAGLLAVAKIATLVLNVANLLLVREWVRRWQGELVADLTAGVYGCVFLFYETVNGMETPLLVTLLFAMLLLGRREGRRARIGYLLAGAGVVLTRWEAIWLLIPFALLERPVRRAVVAGASWVGVFVASTMWRWWYFGALLPNTITAKRHPPYSDPAWHEGVKARLMQPGAIVAACWFAALVAAGYLAYLLMTRQAKPGSFAREWRRSYELRFALLFTGFAGLLATGIGPNWGPPLRTFYAGWPFLLGLVLLPLGMGDRAPRGQRGVLAGATAVLCGLTLWRMAGLLGEMSAVNAPTYMQYVTVDKIARLNGMLDDVRVASGRKTLVYAGPDIGGILLYAKGIQVVDLGLLCDQVLARKGFAAVETYVLGERRPDVIEVHRFWTRLTGLESSPRFRAEYEPVEVDGIRVFLRRELVAGIPAERLREERFSEDGSFAEYDPQAFPYIRYNQPDWELNRSFGSYLVLAGTANGGGK